MRTCVEGVERERGARARLGFVVAAALLEAEGVHGEDGVVAGQFRRPRRQHRRDALLHALHVAADVVERVRHLQRERIARLEAQELAEGGARPVEVIVVQERCERGDMEALAPVGRQRSGARERRACHGDAARVAAADEQVRLQHVGHHEARRLAQGARERCLGAVAPALIDGQRALEFNERRRLGARDRAAAVIAAAHGEADDDAAAGAMLRFMRNRLPGSKRRFSACRRGWLPA